MKPTHRTAFKAADLTRAVKAAKACGLTIIRTEISPDGTIVMVHSGAEPASPFDEWKNRHDARAA